MTRRFADGTDVSVGKSRGEIDDLLRRWKCDGIQWTDNFSAGQVVLRFVWSHEGQPYMARFIVRLPTDEQLEARCRKERTFRTRITMDEQMSRAREARGRREMRVLALWLKGALNAVEVGIVDAATLFLPFLEGSDGRTVAEAALPRLRMLIGTGAASAMLQIEP